jgi:hypothetical protein
VSEDKNQTGVNDQLKDFKENEKEYNKTIRDIVLFASLGIALILHSGFSLFQMVFDESIPLVICPRDYDLDKPVIMKTISENDKAFVQDRWIRGFVRNYVMSLFPRTDQDAVPFFSFIKNHSSYSIADKYKSYLDSAEGIKKMLENGQGVRFYPKSSSGVRIRPTQTDGKQTEWVVEVDGYLNKGYHQNAERTLPTIRMTITAQPPTRTNPDGLLVTDLILDNKILDLVSGRKKSEQKETEE